MFSAEPHEKKGSALVVVMVIMAVLIGLCAFMLEDAVSKMRTSTGAVEAGKSFHLAEGGIDLAIADLNAGNDGSLGTDAWNPATDDSNPNGRPDFGENNVTPVSVGAEQFLTYCIDWTNDGVDNDGVNGIDDPGEKDYRTLYCTARADSDTRFGTTAVVEVIVVPIPTSLFQMSLFGDEGVTIVGNSFSDSYDSDLGNYAAQATNNHAPTGETYAKVKGDAASNQNISGNGTITIFGNATPGPGGSTTLTGSSFVNGSTAPASDPTPLETPTYAPPVGSSGDYKQPGGSPATLGSGEYRYSSFSLKATKTLTITGDVTLYVDGDFAMAGQGEIIINPGAKLTVQHNSGDVSLTGNGVTNNSMIPGNFTFKSSSNGTFKTTGSNAFYGAVYAPDMDVDIGGGTDKYGAFIGKTIKVHGGPRFHYDEALGRMDGGNPRFRLRCWRQIQ